jgi:hypothetical protein
MRSALVVVIAMVWLTGACGGSGTEEIKPGPMPENGTFSGVYFSPQYGEMHMVQNGSAVVGKYKKDERAGTLQGEANGDVMRFEWTEFKALVSNRPQQTRGHGYFRYMVDASNGDHLIKGRWGLNDDNTTGGEWNAYKSRTREPDMEHFAPELSTAGGDKGEKTDDSGNSSEGTGSDKSGGDQGGDDIF